MGNKRGSDQKSRETQGGTYNPFDFIAEGEDFSVEIIVYGIGYELCTVILFTQSRFSSCPCSRQLELPVRAVSFAGDPIATLDNGRAPFNE